MKVKMLVSVSGSETTLSIGQEVELDDAYAKRMMETDPPQCIPILPAAPVESRIEPTQEMRIA